MGLLGKILIVGLVIYILYMWNPEWFLPVRRTIDNTIMKFKSAEHLSGVDDVESLGIANYLRGSAVATPTCGDAESTLPRPQKYY
jgi:hypothetical protein